MKGIFELGQLGDWKRLCTIQVSSGQERQFFERWFKPYAVNENGSFKGLFTGYFIPQLRGSYTRSERYYVPIYRTPSSAKLRRQSRSQIYNGGLQNKGFAAFKFEACTQVVCVGHGDRGSHQDNLLWVP